MRIGIDARFYRSSTGGIGRYTRALIRELAKIDSQNEYVVFLTKEDKKEYDEQISNSQFPISNFRKKIVPIVHYTIAEQTKFLSILNKEKLDLVHFTNFNHPILYRRKFIVTIHDLTVMLYPVGRQQKSLIRRWAFKTVMRHAIDKSSQVIAVSRSTKKDIIKILGGNPNKIQIIYEGIDRDYHRGISNFPASPAGRQFPISKKYGIKKPYILFLSQWRPHKGLPELIKAFEILKKKYPSTSLGASKIPHQLVIGGKPNPAFPEIPHAISHSPFAKDIITPGFIPEQELPLFYAGADLFVFPSHYEGFGLPPLEAMACGMPVAASNRSCLPEILGKAAEYFDPNNIADMADKIHQTLINADLRKSMIKRGLEQTKKYSWQKMARETLEVYKKVLQSN